MGWLIRLSYCPTKPPGLVSKMFAFVENLIYFLLNNQFLILRNAVSVLIYFPIHCFQILILKRLIIVLYQVIVLNILCIHQENVLHL